ncbi:hypothetical protein BTH95_03570 [Lactobacillus delbrueckii subsp. bulgaricus]|nr:hypothetical protein [Lactobacillus delbrueckii subsp. bulgaricus]MBT8825001.1 hypothetical protein [Lactobacillus delbrueckii subsp. bulgaricus]MBT8841183.1 hypothetical protein [Lactobacillus delbrueckii subsp. bulgaricus]MBT8845866.1 hypothetical protein [Lactobacillus delbrueckii subsp. bulgaricus]
MKPYLTKSDFEKLGYELKKPDNFDKLLKNATVLINQICSYYDPAFAYHDLEADAKANPDSYLFRQAMAFKKAVALEMLFLEDSGYSSAYELAQGTLSSFTVGHTSMSLNASAGQNLTVGGTGVVKPAYDLLGRYGLIFSGVSQS